MRFAVKRFINNDITYEGLWGKLDLYCRWFEHRRENKRLTLS